MAIWRLNRCVLMSKLHALVALAATYALLDKTNIIISSLRDSLTLQGRVHGTLHHWANTRHFTCHVMCWRYGLVSVISIYLVFGVMSQPDSATVYKLLQLVRMKGGGGRREEPAVQSTVWLVAGWWIWTGCEQWWSSAVTELHYSVPLVPHSLAYLPALNLTYQALSCQWCLDSLAFCSLTHRVSML